MLLLLSPAKKLLKVEKPYNNETTEPYFLKESSVLAQLMKSKSVKELATLMNLSQDLAVLNYERYQQFHLKSIAPESYPAVFLFQGDVYQGLEADTWQRDDLRYSQKHLRILSGLYGLLNPLDRIQAYRLEMGVRLENPRGATLYDFWKSDVTNALNKQLALQANPMLINLASTEYSKVVDQKKLDYPFITINFYEQKNHKIKMIGIYSKKARGLMAQFIIRNQIDNLNQLKEFNHLGYCFRGETSSDLHLDFIRAH
jgi:cytoplasmic iron level regulating protein YaaA (DUF328/UPF0246 family)